MQPRPLRRSPGPWLAVLATLLVSGPAAGELLPVARDLQADARMARAQQAPIVLFFHTRSCPFCREVEALYLQPLLQDSKAAPRFILRAVEVDRNQPLVGFDGTRTDSRTLAAQQGVTLVPHLRFLGPDGLPLASDLVGLTSRDFYYGYLLDAISLASDTLHRHRPVRTPN